MPVNRGGIAIETQSPGRPGRGQPWSTPYTADTLLDQHNVTHPPPFLLQTAGTLVLVSRNMSHVCLGKSCSETLIVNISLVGLEMYQLYQNVSEAEDLAGLLCSMPLVLTGQSQSPQLQLAQQYREARPAAGTPA
ncbi:hypothetical protein J6590_039248 [Homalodisca vitripennis]|nr:hypothetical protein J6590_039248 [Homalodisca vitripennis]